MPLAGSLRAEPPVRFVPHTGPATFLDRAEAWLLEAEDEHNLFLSIAYAREAAGSSSEADLFATVEDEGAVVGCAFRTPPHKLAVTRMPSGGLELLLASVLDTYEHIPGVLGPGAVAETIAAAWSAVRGVDWCAGSRQRMYRLDAVVPPEGVPGRLRRAEPEELDLALAWGDGFAADAGAEFRPQRASVERWLEHGRLYWWTDPEPVSMAVAQGRTPNGIRIGFVYTPPERRGRGYASACVAELSARMLAEGLRFCVLYTDLANPTSNRIYQRLGYRPLCDVVSADILAAD